MIHSKLLKVNLYIYVYHVYKYYMYTLLKGVSITFSLQAVLE